MATYLETCPQFASGSLDIIQSAVNSGTLSYPAYIYVTDTKQLAFVDKSKNVQIIKGVEQVIKVDALPDISDGDENVLYIYDGIVYVFTGKEYKPMYSDVTTEVLTAVGKLSSKVDALEEAIGNITEGTSGLVFSSFENFPEVGVENQLYIDISGNCIYRYDNSEESYILLSGLTEQTDLPITVKNGEIENIIVLADLDNGTYFISGYYKVTETEATNIISKNVLVLVDSDYENKYITEFNSGEIIKYTVKSETDELTTDYYALQRLDETPTEGSENPVTSGGIYKYVNDMIDEKIIGAMEAKY